MITTAHLNIEKLELEKITKNISVPHLSSCNCIGPQNNEPKCPCMMSGVVTRDGRWVELERDLGKIW